MSAAPMLRSRRQANEVGCVVSGFKRLEVGCNSVKNMEFYSSCENKEVITGELQLPVESIMNYDLY